jgi:type I restriction enzyme R subunit
MLRFFGVIPNGEAMTDLQLVALEGTLRQEKPLDQFGEDAVERWFTEEEVDELIEFTESLAA